MAGSRYVVEFKGKTVRRKASQSLGKVVAADRRGDRFVFAYRSPYGYSGW